jgi:hypothetical protein
MYITLQDFNVHGANTTHGTRTALLSTASYGKYGKGRHTRAAAETPLQLEARYVTDGLRRLISPVREGWYCPTGCLAGMPTCSMHSNEDVRVAEELHHVQQGLLHTMHASSLPWRTAQTEGQWLHTSREDPAVPGLACPRD